MEYFNQIYFSSKIHQMEVKSFFELMWSKFMIPIMMKIGNLDDGGPGTSPETISKLKFMKCFQYLWSLQIGNY